MNIFLSPELCIQKFTKQLRNLPTYLEKSILNLFILLKLQELINIQRFLSYIYWIENALNVNCLLCYFKPTNNLYVEHCFKPNFEFYHTFKYLHTTAAKNNSVKKRLVDNLIDIFYNKETLKQT